MATPSGLHEDLAELAFLLGDWSGTGEGVWAPGEPFDYAEDVSFEHVGDAFLVYSQWSWSLDDGSPIHFERGFLRPAGGVVELVLAHPIGITEVAVGSVQGDVIELSSTAIGLAPTASPVTELRRRIEVRADSLSYELHMAMEGIELVSHVRSRLERA
jgi:nitrobindin-like protein